MPYEMKNRFLIMGLTGPLGSGCTTTAKFLSGMNGNGNKLKNLILDQLKTDNQTKKNINAKYHKIDDAKKKITELISKQRKIKGENQQFGTFYLDKPVESNIEKLKNTLEYNHKDLKNFLYIREVNKTLQDFSQSEVFKYTNINQLDKEIFGFNPFAYISFTIFIVKLAFESFCFNGGENKFKKYFDEKSKKYKLEDDKLADAFQIIKENIHKQFKRIDDRQYKSFEQANQFVVDRNYFVLTDYHTKEERIKSAIPDIKKLHKRIIPEYFRYLKFINSILDNIKVKKSKKRLGNYQIALSEVLQDWGDNIRKNGNPFDLNKELKRNESIYKLSNEINLAIKFLRYRIRYVDKNYNLIKRDDKTENRPLQIVLECFRNPYEVDFFRSRYSEFYLISLFADNPIREERAANFTKGRDDRDKGQNREPSEIHKLDVNACVLQSDISINNNNISKDQLFKKLFKYFCLIRNPGCLPPNDDELFMHLAYSLSLKSTCISRKVGAVIIGPKGYIYGAGWNDVSEGQIGCGLRTKDDYLNISCIPKIPQKFDPKEFDNMISKSNGEYICYKDIMSKIYIDKKINNPKSKGNKARPSSMDIDVKRLEYCRALHAEENALLQLAKIGGNSILDGTIYTTTYPCELCAKKIYQTGIKTVFYTEPYPETISEEVFLEDGSHKIEAIQFEGIKSNSFYKLFKPIYDKKELSNMFI